MKLSEHFDASEFACKCGCHGLHNGADINPRLVQVLERARKIVEKPLVISSGYRCPNHNDAVGGVSNSQHTLGNAADVLFDNPPVLAMAAEYAGADGIGIYEWGCHIDVRGEKALW